MHKTFFQGPLSTNFLITFCNSHLLSQTYLLFPLQNIIIFFIPSLIKTYILLSLLHLQTKINTRYLILNISQFTWIWNLLRLIFLLFRIAWFVSAYFRPIKLELIYNFNNIIRKKYTEIYINSYRQTDRDLTVFCLRLKYLFDPFFFFVWSSNLLKTEVSGTVLCVFQRHGKY